MVNKMKIIIVHILLAIILLSGCQPKKVNEPQKYIKIGKAKVTFIELGSVNCIPCKAMQPVMQSLEKKYGDQLQVIFYDVWTKEQKQFAYKYKVNLIPTQVFLDKEGKEFFRHEGFFAEAEIDKILNQRGLKKLN